MRSIMLSLLMGFFLLAADGRAQVDVQVQPEMQILVLMLKEAIPQSNGMPMVTVQLGKVLLRNGEYAEELPIRLNEMRQLSGLLQKQFRLYCGPNRFGIFKYAAVPNERKPKKSNNYLEAMPMDQDDTVQAMINKTRLQADISNLLNLTLEEASTAAQNETQFKETFAKAQSAEIALLQNGKKSKTPLFFVPVKVQN
jgi:hypothetical protein